MNCIQTVNYIFINILNCYIPVPFQYDNIKYLKQIKL